MNSSASNISTDSINPKPSFPTPTEEFNPTRIPMNAENALEHIAILDGRTFDKVGSSELHMGIHPNYGRCIIIVSDDSAAIIPFA